MRGAREATAAAIDTLRDGTSFAVIAGTHVAREVYPGQGRLATADPATRAQAKEALRGLGAAWRHRHRHLAAPRRRPAARVDGHHPARDPAHRRPQRARGARRAARHARRLRGPLHLRRARCRHRLGGEGRHGHRGRAARLRRHRGRSRPPERGLHAHDGERHGQGGGGRLAAPVDAGRRGDPVRQAGRARRPGPHRPPHRSRSARGRLPDRFVGRRVPRVPRVRTGAGCVRRPGDAGRAGHAGDAPGRR